MKYPNRTGNFVGSQLKYISRQLRLIALITSGLGRPFPMRKNWKSRGCKV